MRISALAATICLAFMGLATATESHAAIRRVTSIPAQGLGPALQLLAKEHDFQVVYVSEEVNDLHTRGAAGELTRDEALNAILSGTGMSFRYVDENTVTVFLHSSGTKSETSSSASNPMLQAGNGSNAASRVQNVPSDRLLIAQTVEKATDQNQRTANRIEKPTPLDEVLVTGSHIRGVTGSASPLMVFDREAIERTGYSTVDQFIESLPQNLSGVGQDTANTNSLDAATNFGDGTSINLRGLGGKATLVLVNGRRLAPAGFFGSFIDASLVPLSAIERIEILTDGASAIYGSDAVGGVVNFILRTNYEGAETSVQIGSITDGDMAEYRVAQALGGNWDGGSALLSYEFYSRDDLEARYRDFSSDAFPSATLLPNQERHNVYVVANHEFSNRLQLFSDGLYFRRDSTSVQDPALTGGFPIFDNETTQVQVSLGAKYPFGDNWKAQVIAGYSDYELTSPGRFGFDLSADADAMSFEGQIDGTVVDLPGGALRLALGSTFRQENFSSIGAVAATSTTAPERDVAAFYGELFVPLVGRSNRRRGMEALELSLAARYEDYSDYGDDVTPKVGLRWEPVAGLSVRSSYGESFKAPNLNDVYSPEFVLVFNSLGFAPGAPLLLLRDGGNPDLVAETAKTWTVGFDLRLERTPLSISATYYSIDFDNRIGSPTFGFFDFFFFPERFGELLIPDPDDALVDMLLANADLVFNLAGPNFTPAPFTSTDVDLIADDRQNNVAIEKQSGYDVTINYLVEAARDRFDFSLNGTYMNTFDRKLTSTSPVSDVRNILNGPIDLRARGGVSWSRGQLGASLFVNYQDDYRNSDADSTAISSWTTVDLALRYELGDPAGERIYDGLDISFSVINIFEEDPPHLSPGPFNNINYDAANSDPLGRFVSLTLRKKW